MGGTAAIEAEHLSKRFGSLVAVDDVSLRVEEGDVFGFIGPNGAGKTTTIRMLLGLVAPSGGRVRLFGHDVAHDFKRAIRKVGAMVEGPAFYGFLSGRRNLRLFGGISGGVSEGRIQEVLGWVGLGKRGDGRVAGYSQGMRQRLGIALALLEAPRLLVLDEPTNGLDPQGTREIRQLIRRICAETKTSVLLSSHLLAEMELICDRVAIIAEGRILLEGSLDAVIGEDAERIEIAVAPEHDERAASLLRERFQVSAARPRRGQLEFALGQLEPASLNRALIEAGIEVTSFAPRRRSLEQAFVDLTGSSSEIR